MSSSSSSSLPFPYAQYPYNTTNRRNLASGGGGGSSSSVSGAENVEVVMIDPTDDYQRRTLNIVVTFVNVKDSIYLRT